MKSSHSLPTPTELRYFLEVYQTRHISNAALRLGISQPTLTHALQSLEIKLGAGLFRRTRQGALPTESGHRLHGQARNLIDHWEGITTAVRNTTDELSGRFRLGCHESVGAYTLPQLYQRLDAQAPRIELLLTHDLSRKITERVIAYELDLGFVVNPTRHPDLVLKKIGTDDFCFWKAGKSQPIPKRIYANLELAQTQALLKKSLSKHFPDWNVVHTGSFELTRTLISNGLGVGILPARIAAIDPGLERHDVNLPVFQDEIFLAYRRELLANRAGKTLVGLATGVLK